MSKLIDRLAMQAGIDVLLIENALDGDFGQNLIKFVELIYVEGIKACDAVINQHIEDLGEVDNAYVIGALNVKNELVERFELGIDPRGPMDDATITEGCMDDHWGATNSGLDFAAGVKFAEHYHSIGNHR